MYIIGYKSESGYDEDIFVPFKYLKPYFDICLDVDLDIYNTSLKYLDVKIEGICNCKACPDEKPDLYTMSDILCKEKVSEINQITYTGKYPTNQDMFLDMAILLVKCAGIEATIEYKCQIDDEISVKFFIKNKKIKLLKYNRWL